MKKEYSRFSDSTVFEGIVSLRTLISVMADNSKHNDRRILRVYYDKERKNKEKKEYLWLSHRADEFGFEIVLTSRECIDEITVGNTHGGIAVAATGRNLLSPSDSNIKKHGFYVILEGIEDPYNFGYALRSLYAAGADGIILGERNWMSAAGVVCRASAGASEMLDIFSISSPSAEIAEMFKAFGYKIICADIEKSVPIYEADMSYPLLLVIGGERRGISKAMLDKADVVVRIDYARSFEASLSAASAATVVGYEVFRQRKLKLKK